jgi:DNA-binding winged helix-turn-helix (wHTH) protein/TolB-like protein
MSSRSTTPDAEDLARRGFRVGDWDVHPLQGVIERAGHRVRVEPKVMDVLLCLARHDGAVVTRDVLLQEVWPGVVVTDDVVTRCISELRTALEDTGRERRFIRTIPKRGYSLLVPVQPAGSAPAPAYQAPPAAPTPPAPPAAPLPAQPPAQPRPLDGAARLAREAASATGRLVRLVLLGLGVLIVVIVGLALVADGGDGDGVKITVINDDPAAVGGSGPTAIRSLAVLPFRHASDAADSDVASDLADDLAYDIRATLGDRDDLRLAESPDSPRDVADDPRQVAATLGVDALVDGTVRVDADRVRVTVQLTDGKTGQPRWGATFDSPADDLDALVADVTAAVARKVPLRGEAP